MFILILPLFCNCGYGANDVSVNRQRSYCWIVPIDDKIISPPLAEFLEKTISKAESSNCSAIVFLIDTPGGFLPSTEKIIKAILGTNIPTIAYVYPRGARAGSAGVFISFACDMVVMAPNTRIGAAHPVMFGEIRKNEKSIAYAEEKKKPGLDENKEKDRTQSENKKGWNDKEIIQEKVLNDVLAMFRSYISEKHPKANLNICEDLIKKSKSLTEVDALGAGIIDGICENLYSVIELAKQKGLLSKNKKYYLHFVKFSGMDLFMYYLTNPYLLYVLSSISVLLLLFEFTHPGFGLPGIVGLVGLAVVMYGYGLLPVNYLGVWLSMLGILFCVGEVFSPGFGLLAGAGIVLIIWGTLLAWSGPQSLFHFGLSFLIPMAILFSAGVIAVVSLALTIKRKPSLMGQNAMIGKIGEVIEDVSSEKGKVFILGEYWNARTEGQIIPKGNKVEVIGVDGLTVMVKERR